MKIAFKQNRIAFGPKKHDPKPASIWQLSDPSRTASLISEVCVEQYQDIADIDFDGDLVAIAFDSGLNKAKVIIWDASNHVVVQSISTGGALCLSMNANAGKLLVGAPHFHSKQHHLQVSGFCEYWDSGRIEVSLYISHAVRPSFISTSFCIRLVSDVFLAEWPACHHLQLQRQRAQIMQTNAFMDGLEGSGYFRTFTRSHSDARLERQDPNEMLTP